MQRFFKVRAKPDGLWLEMKFDANTVVTNLLNNPQSLEYPIAHKIWAQLRRFTCYRCGESREETSGCRDPDCPGSLEEHDR
jgi:hypothetical protein